MRKSSTQLLAVAWSCCAFARVGRASADDKQQCSKAYVDAQTSRVEHQLLSSRRALLTCTRAECAPFMRGQIVRDCTDWLAQVQTSIPTVVLAARTASGEDAVGVSAFVDHGTAAVPLDGHALEVDPGQHVFNFVRGRISVVKTVTVLDGARSQFILAVFDSAGAERAPPGALLSAASEPARLGSPPFLSSRTIVPFSIGALGVLTGAVFGVLALHDKSTLDANCPSGHCASRAQQSDIDALHTNSWISNVGFGVGFVGIATGIVLWLSDRPASAAAGVSLGNAGVQLRPWLGTLEAACATRTTGAGLSGSF